MPNRDPSNKNISICIPKELRERIKDFINKKNLTNDVDEKKMTLRLFIVYAGMEYIKSHGG
jgi:hypothetical protein